MNWDDIKFVLAVARGGSATAAARVLGVNATTVSRRIQALEGSIQARLFDRVHNALTPTTEGFLAIEAAERIERELFALQGNIEGRETEMSGQLSVACPDSLVELWASDLARFNKCHPEIELTVSAKNEMIDLDRREADVAVRISRGPPENLLGKCLTEVYFAIYSSETLAHSAFLERGKSLSGVPWIGWEEPFAAFTDHVVATCAPGARIPLRVNAIRALEHAIVQGVGVSLLPCFHGDRNSALVRVGDYLSGGTFLWVLTHPALRKTARVRAFRHAATEWAKRDTELLAGRRPRTASVIVPRGQ